MVPRIQLLWQHLPNCLLSRANPAPFHLCYGVFSRFVTFMLHEHVMSDAEHSRTCAILVQATW
jgi:hypothetical protein